MPAPQNNNEHEDELLRFERLHPYAHGLPAAGAGREFVQCKQGPRFRLQPAWHRCNYQVTAGNQYPTNKSRRRTPFQTAQAS